jgi:UPF0176 protein|tara:strand:- start:1184 stop:2092 length:909 start_codon:yes stop_codon:yes gene_type:complete
MHNNYKIISFYEFIKLNNLEQQKSKLFNFLRKKNSKGTILIANEGINGTISVSKDNYKEIVKFINKLLKKEIDFKIQSHSEHAFLRLKIKIKNEIIKLGKKNIFPQKITGNRITPSEWDKLISKKNVVLIDTRNIYESRIGTFKGSILVNSSNFTEFPKWVKKNEKKIKNKKIAMFCTGGVRCEKASSYLINQGFKDVFQLSGGILGYFKKTKNVNKNWNGECFVFDERVSLTEKLSKGNYDQCFGCRSPIDQEDKKSKNYKKGIYCPHCFNMTTSLQKKSFEERHKQIELAKKKGIKHLGS